MSEHKPYTLEEILTFVGKLNDHIIQKYPDLYEDEERAAYARVAKLSEETGELAEAVLHHFSRQRKTKDSSEISLADEIADVILVALLLAKQLDVDIDKALIGKFKKLQDRIDRGE